MVPSIRAFYGFSAWFLVTRLQEPIRVPCGFRKFHVRATCRPLRMPTSLETPVWSVVWVPYGHLRMPYVRGDYFLYERRYRRASGTGPFFGPGIYLSVNLFILKYMNPHKVSDRRVFFYQSLNEARWRLWLHERVICDTGPYWSRTAGG